MSKVSNIHRHYQHHVQFHFNFFSKSVAIAQFSFKNILKFLLSVSIYVFISIKTTSPHEGKLRPERIENSGTLSLYTLEVLVHMRTTAKELTPCDAFFRNHEPNRVPEMTLSYLQNIPTYYHSGKYKMSIRSALEYCYTIVFVRDILCPTKGCFVHDIRNLQ